MRKLLAPILCLGLLFSAAPASSRPVYPYAGAEQWAFADWVKLGRTRGTIVGAAALRIVGEVGVVTLGTVYRGTCKVQRFKHGMMASCSARGRVHEIDFQDFTMDPLQRDASLSLRSGGQTHTVQWKGRGTAPVAGGGVSGGGDAYAAAGAEMWRDAKTSGKVFGKIRKSRSWLDWGFMANFAGVGVFADGSNPRITLKGDRIHVEHSFKLRR